MIKHIAVIGAGTMGRGIALAFALYGFKVNVFDTNPENVEKAKKDIKEHIKLLAELNRVNIDEGKQVEENICYVNKLKEAVYDRDYVIEAIPEILSLKQALFEELDKYCPKETIFASNTSSLDLEKMAEKVSDERKKRMMLNHWYNPAYIMPIVELSNFGNTLSDVYKAVDELYEFIGKQRIEVLKSIPGLVANRIQQSVAREVFSLLQQKVASPEDIDRALMFGPAFRYATTGQLMIADMGGLDIWCTVGDNLLKEMDNRTSSNPYLREKVNQGKLGIKTGEGFYHYDPALASEVKKQFHKKLLHQLQASEYYTILRK